MNLDELVDINIAWIIAEFGDAEGRAIIRELQYYNAYGKLPDNAVYIERIHWENGMPIIVHADPDLRQ